MPAPELLNIPGELCKRPQWVVWRTETRDGKPTKIPYTPGKPLTAKHRAKANDPRTWGQWNAAVKAAHPLQEAGKGGVGFVFSPEDPYTGVDLDKCRDPDTGDLEEWAQKILFALNSYTEISPSGAGLHIIVKATLPPGRRRQGRVEMYDRERYFTMTGAHLEGTPATIEDRQAEIEALHHEIFGSPQNTPRAASPTSPAPIIELSDQDLLEKARQAKNGEKFSKLWGGDTAGYPSPSEATAALLDLLAFWCGRDPARIDRLFRQSGLMRDKWNRPTSGSTWGALEVDKAITRAREFYKPGQRQTTATKRGRAGQDKKKAEKVKEYNTPENKEVIERVVKELNKKHSVVMVGGQCRILNEVINSAFNRPDITLSALQDFKNYYGNKKVALLDKDGNTFKVPITHLWLDSPERRQYEGIVFSPQREMTGFYNLYKGLAVQPAPGDWSLFHDHIKKIITNNNKDHFNYVMQWMAKLVQDPGGPRLGVALVLRGPQGSGKGCYVTHLGKLVGSHFLHITNPLQLTGRFNSHLKDCLLCFADEALWAGDKVAEGILKGMITENLNMVEFKGKDAFQVQNFIHLIIASNSQWVVPAGLEDRRFCVLDVNPEKKQDRGYFGKIYKQMENGGLAAMLHDLLQHPVNLNFLASPPQTMGLFEQKVHTLNAVEKFWFQKLCDGRLLKAHEGWEDWVSSDALYEDYLISALHLGERYKKIKEVFFKEIKKLCPDAMNSRRRIEGKLTQGYVFPDLDGCREVFAKQARAEIEWDADEIPF